MSENPEKNVEIGSDHSTVFSSEKMYDFSHSFRGVNYSI